MGTESGTLKIKEKQLPLRACCDVLVAGGGTAGCVAALAAARNGADTILIEQLPMIGGTFANGGILALSFHSAYVTPGEPVKKIVEGIAAEYIEKLTAAGGCSGYVGVDPAQDQYQNAYIVIPDACIAPSVMAQMLLDAGVRIYTHTFLAGVRSAGGRVGEVIIQSKSGREVIAAKQFVDCTGDGDLAAKAGAQYTTSLYDHYVDTGNIGFVFGVGNVDTDSLIAFAQENGLLKGASIFPTESSEILRLRVDLAAYAPLREKCKAAGIGGGFMLSRHRNCIDYVNAIGLSNVNVLDVAELTHAEMELRAKAMDWVRFYRENVPGFRRAFMNWSANQVGIRAMRSIACLYELNNDDIVHSARFSDEIGCFGYHDLAPISEKYTMLGQGFYGIPYRAIVPKGVVNLLVAGRMVSTDYEAQMSTRNTVNCMIQGQAAGTAAALCAKSGISPAQLGYGELREHLLKGGVHFEPIPTGTVSR